MFVFSLLLLFFLSLSPLVLSLGLVLFCLSSVFFLVLTHRIPSVLGVTLLLVYLGRLIIISCYVCAVMPNSASPCQKSFLSHILFISFLFFINFIYTVLIPFSSTPTRPLRAGSMFFTIPGLFPFIINVFLLILVLNSPSTLSSTCAPLRT